MISLLIIDADSAFSRRLQEKARLKGDIDVVGIVDDGADALGQIHHHTPAAVILALSLPTKDGFTVLRDLSAEPPQATPKIIVTGNAAEENMFPLALDMGAHYCVLKPFDAPTLLKRVRQLTDQGPALLAPDRAKQRENVTRQIVDHLHAFGVPPHFKGFRYLVDAVQLVAYDPPLLHAITKFLYPAVARRHHTSAERVERAIRNAIEVTMTRGDLGQIQRVFGYSVDAGKGKPSNSSFIARLADQVRLDHLVG